MIDHDQLCPRCGRHVGGSVRPYCTPLSCSAWAISAIYDKATGQWVPANEEENRNK